MNRYKLEKKLFEDQPAGHMAFEIFNELGTWISVLEDLIWIPRIVFVIGGVMVITIAPEYWAIPLLSAWGAGLLDICLSEMQAEFVRKLEIWTSDGRYRPVFFRENMYDSDNDPLMDLDEFQR